MSENKLFQKLNTDLQAALKKGEKNRLAVLRMMKNQVLQVNPKGDLSDPEIMKVLQKYGKKLKDGAGEFRKAGREDTAKEVEGELAIVEEYLPRAASLEEITKAVESAIQEIGATSMKEMGRVMKAVQAKFPTAEGAAVSQIVRGKLGA